VQPCWVWRRTLEKTPNSGVGGIIFDKSSCRFWVDSGNQWIGPGNVKSNYRSCLISRNSNLAPGALYIPEKLQFIPWAFSKVSKWIVNGFGKHRPDLGAVALLGPYLWDLESILCLRGLRKILTTHLHRTCAHIWVIRSFPNGQFIVPGTTPKFPGVNEAINRTVALVRRERKASEVTSGFLGTISRLESASVLPKPVTVPPGAKDPQDQGVGPHGWYSCQQEHQLNSYKLHTISWLCNSWMAHTFPGSAFWSLYTYNLLHQAIPGWALTWGHCSKIGHDRLACQIKNNPV
jgi:hypothetical protein